jgi:hypothetical protein
MKRSAYTALLPAMALALLPLAAAAAAKPQPMPAPTYPNKHLHARLLVEVNKRGQVVRVDHGTLSGDRAVDTIWLGNAMQMWIRKPDGTAITGLYSVSYDYNPKTHVVTRVPQLVKAGGAWANKPGAATSIIADAKRQVHALEVRLHREEARQRAESAKHLPDINAAVRRAMAKPTSHPGAQR